MRNLPVILLKGVEGYQDRRQIPIRHVKAFLDRFIERNCAGTVREKGYVQSIAEPVCWDFPSLPEGQVRHHSDTGVQLEREGAAIAQREARDDTSVPSSKVELRLSCWNGPIRDRHHPSSSDSDCIHSEDVYRWSMKCCRAVMSLNGVLSMRRYSSLSYCTSQTVSR